MSAQLRLVPRLQTKSPARYPPPALNHTQPLERRQGLFKVLIQREPNSNPCATVTAVVSSGPSLLCYMSDNWRKKKSLFAVTVSCTDTDVYWRTPAQKRREFRGRRRGSHYLTSQNRKMRRRRRKKRGDNTKGRGVSDRPGSNTQSHV